jgi:hypothetical protein
MDELRLRLLSMCNFVVFGNNFLRQTFPKVGKHSASKPSKWYPLLICFGREKGCFTAKNFERENY